MSATILYFNYMEGDRIQDMVFAGIRRYATVLGWKAEVVSWSRSRPEDISAVLREYRPVVGCVVRSCDDNPNLTPGLFGRVPVVYLHAAPSLHGGRIARVSTDNGAVSRIAFRELSASRPAAFATVDACWNLEWAKERIRVFSGLCSESGMVCHVFPFRDETEPERVARLEQWVKALPRKTAVFAVNDRTAAEVAAAAKAARRSIPRELKLIGVDNDTPVCETVEPPLSSIQIDFERAGFVAARMIGEGRASPHPVAGKRTPPIAIVGPLLAVRRRSTSGSGRREKFVLAAVETIRREASDGLTPESLIGRFRCSRRLFEIRFREAMGHSVLDEIRHVRLEKACALLAKTDTAIGAIAGLCGYNSDIALKFAFRKATGMSMREWRNRSRR